MMYFAMAANSAVLLLFTAAAMAQTGAGPANYPVRPIRIIDQGQEPQSSTPAELVAHMRAESVRWSDVIKRAGLKLER